MWEVAGGIAIFFIGLLLFCAAMGIIGWMIEQSGGCGGCLVLILIIAGVIFGIGYLIAEPG